MFKINSLFMALISDVHSNLEALTAVLSDIEGSGIDCIGFLGDAVGYGPDPVPCLNLLKEKCDFMLSGNHDRAAALGEGLEEMSPEARKIAEWTAERLSGEDMDFLKSLPVAACAGDFLFAHGSPLSPESFDYVLSVSQSKKVFLENPHKCMFIGHSHIPTVFVEMEFKRMFAGHAHRVVEKSLSCLKIDPEKRYLVNVGSVGQPRDGDCRAAYGVLDLEKAEFDLRRVGYDMNPVIEKMKRAGFGEHLTNRLSRGV